MGISLLVAQICTVRLVLLHNIYCWDETNLQPHIGIGMHAASCIGTTNVPKFLFNNFTCMRWEEGWQLTSAVEFLWDVIDMQIQLPEALKILGKYAIYKSISARWACPLYHPFLFSSEWGFIFIPFNSSKSGSMTTGICIAKNIFLK